MHRRLLHAFLALTFGFTASLAPQAVAPQPAPPVATSAPEYGPATGTLLIVGGNMSDNFGVPKKFIELAGGPTKKFVIVPTNGGNRNADGTLKVYQDASVLAAWKRRGLTSAVMLHTWDPKVADTDAFVQPLVDADAVWFDGGRQWNMVDSYMNTRTLAAFRKVLDRGGVIGGTSAGATIQGDYLVRGDTSGPDVMMTDEATHQHGFGFLKRSAIDQHINARNRWDDLIPVVRKFPQLLGIGLSEDTAIVVTGDRFEVIGRWKVTVHDSTRAYPPWRKPYDVLDAGDVYNMKTRRIEARGNGTTPAGRPGA
ncbi:MAG: cyanophycinase [Acidobacteria bacterium]|nr:cyanophycinase [Acidobacteriota bacterium]